MALCAVGAALAALTGCTGSDSTAEREEERTERSTSRSHAPKARSGDLGQEDLPPPTALGRGWVYRVDPGNPEDGYVGSGQPAIARDPRSVIAAITPLGCRPRRLPTPTRALEVTYERASVPAVGLVLQFPDAGTAGRFLDVHRRVLTECVDAHRVDVEVLAASDGALLSTRTEQLGKTPTWVEGVALVGPEVTLIAVADESGRGVRAVRSALAAIAS